MTDGDISSTEAALPAGRPNRIVVDLGAVRANLRVLRVHLGTKVKIFAPLKGNAYGFGLIPVARALESEGTYGIAVVDASDAARLRQAGITCPILLYGGNLPDQWLLESVLRHRLIATIHDRTTAALLATSPRPVDVFIKINVGNERFGFLPEEMVDLASTLRGAANCRIVGAYAHPDVPRDTSSSSYLRWQIDRLTDAADRLQAHGLTVPCAWLAARGCCCRAAICR